MRAEAIGILGSGQLAMMLSEAAAKLKIPCRQFQGSLESDSERTAFFSSVGSVLFESDFLPYEKLSEISPDRFIPNLRIMQRLSDKLEQKKILSQLKIPTSAFLERAPEKPLEVWLDACLERFGDNCVFKWARGGYDGKGVFIYEKDRPRALEFLQSADRQHIRVFCEEKIDFTYEVSQVSVFDGKSWGFYPLVLSMQENGICRWVLGPATRFGISPKIVEPIQGAAKRLGEALDLRGVFAIEMFLTKTGEFLVNEVAPRVHNTGHFSLNASQTSQFENHMRACLDLGLGSCESAKTFGMFNLLGDRGSAARSPIVFASTEFKTALKWYQKMEVRPGRKMGHLNFWDFEPGEWASIQSSILRWESDWRGSL